MKNIARLLAGAAAAALALATTPARAKPIYLTVPRAFGTAEAPVIDLAFQRHGPVELRVLRPEPLDAFLAGQFNLRRSYLPPQTRENPGRYLARGLNATRLPSLFLYRALGEDFRKELAPALPRRDGEERRPVVRLAEGPEKLVDVPPGTQLVHEEWLNLDLGGSGRDYTVPGFDEYGLTSRWEERKVKLDPLPAGIYLVQLVQGRVEGQVVLVVTDLRVEVKQTDGEVLVRVAGRDGAPIPGAVVELRTGTGAGPSGKTDDKGEARLTTAEPRLFVLVRSGQDRALVDTDFYSTLAATPDLFLYTDRPIYRPGDSVHFRGIVRQPDAFLARLFAPRARQVDVSLEGLSRASATTRARVDDFGCFSGELKVPAEAGTGVVRLIASLDGAPHGAEARVEEYLKPSFYVEVLSERETVQPGQPIKARIRARRYAGGPPRGARYEVFLYRSLVDSPAWVDDAGLGAQGSAVTYGTVSTTEGQLSVPERLYSSLDARKEGYSEDPWASAPILDAQGEAEVEIPVPALTQGDERFPWRYSLSVRARDDQGTFATGARPYFLAPSEVVGLVRPGATVVLAGGQAPLAVRATTLAGAPYPGAKGNATFVLKKASGAESKISEISFTVGADGVWRGVLPAPAAGTLVARVTIEDKEGRPWTGEGSILVVGKQGEESVHVPTLELGAQGGPLAPDDEAELVALFPAGWGPDGKDGGKVWITLTGTGIFDTRVVPVEGLSFVYRFPVERRFGSAVYASLAYPTRTGRWEERTVPFRIVPPERTLRVTVTPEREEAEPLGPQTLRVRVTDHLGRGVRAQLSLGVVDRAIYALQGELRPRALDFFYPLVRNNVATFTSAEFQGYGYGELLARAFAGPGHRFAAVKPPTKVREVDTAYWNPAILTDEDGRATATFQLPSNQTIWTASVVAADASGRFGESTAEFAARGGTLLMASAPLFLREGDEAVASVRLARGQRGAGGGLELSVNTEGALAGAPVKEAVTLAAGAEKIVPIPLAGKGSGDGRMVLALAGGDRPLSDRRDLPVRPASVEQVITASTLGGGRLSLDLPPGAEVTSVELSLRPSTVALALAQVEELLTYPHGCLEQLVATTVPNIALNRVLEATGAAKDLDPAARALMAEARSRAAQGIDRILALERPGGGFTWFSGYEQTSVPLTLIALDGLSHAVEAGLLDRDDPRLVESAAWL
ncbi:MAG TPA: MG2 domain-containing protein, partial [Anaeromyxobacter sp.]|nr:MG2 domain-containing protein [Anaeromyxobacter sp.]